MAQKAIITYECDNCGEVELPDGDHTHSLPSGWAELRARGNQGTVFDIHVCVGCLMAIGAAMNDRKHGDSESAKEKLDGN